MCVVRELLGYVGYFFCCCFINDWSIFILLGDMICMKWDIEMGIKVVEFVDYLGDVMSISLNLIN